MRSALRCSCSPSSFMSAAGSACTWGTCALSFLSWVPPMAVGFALLIARHWWWPRPSVLGRLVRVYRRITSSVSWQETWGIFVATRVAVLVVGLLAVYTIGYPDDVPNFRVSESEAMNLPARWDAGWYLNIASGGYRWDPQREEQATEHRVLPGLSRSPSIWSVASSAARSRPTSPPRVLLSHAAFLWALIYLYRLSRDLCGDAHRDPRRHPADRHLSLRSVLRRHLYGVDISPRRGRRDLRVQRAAMGARRGLGPDCRPDAAERVHARVDPGGVRAGSAHMDAPRQLGTRSPCGARGDRRSPVLGVVLYSIYIWALTGNPLQWSAQHAAWGRTFTGAAPFVRSAEVRRRARIRALCPPLAVRADQRRRGSIRACGGDPRGPAAGHSVRHLPPVQPRAAAAGRRLHVDRTCHRDDVPDLHVAGASRQSTRTTVFVAVAFAMLQALAAALFYTWRPFV